MADLMIDAHVHLWKKQEGLVNGKPVYGLGGGKAMFMGEPVQMLPPYMLDDRNTAELLLANMDYAGVSGAIVTQEYLDGDQNEYLLSVKAQYPNLKICGLAEFRKPGFLNQVKTLINAGVDGIKVPAQRFLEENEKTSLTRPEMMDVFQLMQKEDRFLSVDLAEGDGQVSEMEDIITAFPELRIAIGHFGMVTRPKWEKQIQLARYKNVYIESGGMTWLFHKEFYPYPSAVKAVQTAIDLVGIEKLMWGSDYPRTMTAITYKMAFDFIEKSKELTEEEKSLFLGRNAKHFYRFENLKQVKRIRNMVED